MPLSDSVLGLSLIVAGFAMLYVITAWPMEKNMSWMNSLRKFFGRQQVPHATSGEQSVLFVLQSCSPKTLDELSEATRISADQLVPILAKLKDSGKIRITPYRLDNLYWAIRN